MVFFCLTWICTVASPELVFVQLASKAPSSNQPISLKHCFPSGSSSYEFDFVEENDDDDHGGDEGEDDDDQVSDESENDADYVGDDQGGDGDDEAMQPLAKCLHRWQSIKTSDKVLKN